MKGFISKLSINFITFFYERIFHEKMSGAVKIFFKNLSYVGFGMIIAAIFSFIFNIIAGRLLGPAEYGEFTIIQSVAMILCIPMTMGFPTALIKYSSEEVNIKKQQSIVSTTYIFVLMFSIISVIIYFFFSSEISKIFSLAIIPMYLSIVFAILLAFFTLTTSTLRGLHEMKKYGLLYPICGIFSLLVFLIFIFLNFTSSKSMVLSICISYGITGGIVLAFIRKYLKFEFKKDQSYKLLNYGFYVSIGGISTVIYSNVDKILINKYMTTADVGIYRAYSFSFVTMLSLLGIILTTVLFPVASKYKSKKIIYERINKIAPFVAVLGYIFSICLGSIIFMFFGSEYVFYLKIVLLFGIVGIVMFFDMIYGWLMNAVGEKGIRITSFAGIVMAFTNVILNIFLVPLIGIEGAILATIFSYSLSISIVQSKRKYFYSVDVIN